MFNHSKHTASLQPTIYAGKLSLHPYSYYHPGETASQFVYSGYTIKVDEKYDTLLQAAILSQGNPTPANLSVYVNNQRIATFWYAWVAITRSYISTGWN